MSRLIDADALERDGWRMSRTVQIDEKTMEAQTRKPTDFPTIEPERIRGRWVDKDGGLATCSACGDRWGVWSVMNFCPNCGADMRETDGSEN